MDESQIIEIWTVFKEYIDKKNVETAAERYVDLLADYGIEDHVLTAALGSDSALDVAIHYYLDIDKDEVEEDYDWE
jgi:hypothetical protein